MSRIRMCGLAVVLAGACAPALAQSLFAGTLRDFAHADVAGVADVLAGELGGEAGRIASWGAGMVRPATGLVQEVGPLAQEDASYDPMGLGEDFQAPSECADKPECQQCYEKAMARIDFNRYYLHRAWSITHQYARYAEGAMAFGDSASGIHGLAGMSWQLQGKPPVRQALAELKTTYRRKYADYVKGLEGALEELGRCEATHAGNDRWFGRYASVYVGMVKDRYRIED
jgi:hypothetical protein